jgi:GntR family transcriptional regulator/MocR family aminotransferase
MAAEDPLWRQLITLSPQPHLTLQLQVRAAIAQAVLDRRLSPGTGLPSSRQLAQLLGIARITVKLAYGMLVQDGFVLVRPRSGHIVHPRALENAAWSKAVPVRSAESKPDWNERLLSRPSQARHVAKPTDWYNYAYPFVYGQPDPALFPMAEWRQASQLATRASATREWVGDHVDADDRILVEEIRKRVLPRRGIWVSSEQILVTVGAQQAIYIAAALLLNARRTVGIEQPSYPDIRNICRRFGARIHGLPMDRHGLLPSGELAACDVVFVQPSHQNPTTVTMPLARRRRFLEAAAAHDLIIIEDDYDSELTFRGEATPALRGLDHNDRVIYVGSLSKTLAPGLRLGYMVASSVLIAEARAMRRMAVRHAPSNNQRAVALFLQLGHHDAAIKRLIEAYRDRAVALGEALRKHLPELRFRLPTGGSALWAEGPPDVSMEQVAARAARQGMLLDPGSLFFDRLPAPDNALRLGYSAIALERIDPGIQLLAQIIRGARANGRAEAQADESRPRAAGARAPLTREH